MARSNHLRGNVVVTATGQDGGVVPGTVSVLDAWISDPNAELTQFFAADVPALAGLPDPWTIDGLGLTAQAAWSVSEGRKGPWINASHAAIAQVSPEGQLFAVRCPGVLCQNILVTLDGGAIGTQQPREPRRMHLVRGRYPR